MRGLGAIIGIIVLLIILWDAFEVIILPRRVTRRLRLSRLFYLSTWTVWGWLARRVKSAKRRERYLSFYGPLSLLFLIVVWATGMMLAFALVQWAAGPPNMSFLESMYLSGTTFITLGMGVPHTRTARAVLVLEAGTGFGFLALVISYLPVLYQSFAKRETSILLLDARAGSPPSAAEVLARLARVGNIEILNSFLIEWEAWSAELLESHLSFPVLSFFRSQHDNQSWLAALTCILDTCAVLMAEIKGCNPYRAQLTFAMARHAAVDLSLIFRVPAESPREDRLPAEKRKQLRERLREAGLELHDEDAVAAKLAELRGMYEPFVYALGQRFLLTVPVIVAEGVLIDNWQRSPGRRVAGIESLPNTRAADDHFGGV